MTFEQAASRLVGTLAVGFILFLFWTLHWDSEKQLVCEKNWPGSALEGPLFHTVCVQKKIVGEP